MRIRRANVARERIGDLEEIENGQTERNGTKVYFKKSLVLFPRNGNTQYPQSKSSNITPFFNQCQNYIHI